MMTPFNLFSMKGIVLSAYNKRGYAYAAYNFAFSIKHHNPNIQIAILHDDVLLKELYPEHLAVFDLLIPLPEELKEKSRSKDGKIDPALIKTSIYDYLPFEYNLFLDVDALALSDLDKIFDELIDNGGYFYCYLMGTHTIDKGNIVPGMGWAFADQVWEHFNLPEDAVLPAPNSSFLFIKKCDEAKALYKQIEKNIANPIPVDDLRFKWGGGQPDELYLAVALAQAGITGKTPRDYMFMTHAATGMSFSQIEESFPIMCFWGNRNMSRAMFTEWYDRTLIKWHSLVGRRHIFKWSFIKADKYANAATVKVSQAQRQETTLETALLKIDDSILIDSSKLIRSYPDERGRPVRVTNWLNCSMLKFNDKVYFAYRMEATPFCTKMKIGLCLLDENFQPIQSTNIILELHSDLKSAALQSGKSFPKGFHVEDPRLFVFNDELYLSYTDGYQMGQAKINPDTLQSEESFYLDKPNLRRTEKNWTFFGEDKIYSVYHIFPHKILAMDGSASTEVANVEFEHGWKWGELRGGTSPVKVGENYLSFFHSAKGIIYKGHTGRQYFMGAYMFEGKFPYRPIMISKEPLLCGEVMPDGIPRLSNKIFVVFPGGQVRKKDSWVVSFGYNDYQCRLIEIKDEVLRDNLIPIVYKENLIEA